MRRGDRLKTKITILGLSLVLLIVSGFIFLVNYNEKNNNTKTDNNEIVAMDVEYVENNFEIELSDEFKDGMVTVDVKATYIGDDKIVEEPTIKVNIDCLYVYNDAEELFTDVAYSDLELTKVDNEYVASKKITLAKSEIESLSCNYFVVETTGSYKIK